MEDKLVCFITSSFFGFAFFRKTVRLLSILFNNCQEISDRGLTVLTESILPKCEEQTACYDPFLFKCVWGFFNSIFHLSLTLYLEPLKEVINACKQFNLACGRNNYDLLFLWSMYTQDLEGL